MPQRPLGGRRSLPALLALLALLGAMPAAGQEPSAGVERALRDLELASGGPVRATVSEATGLVSFLSFPGGRAAYVSAAAGAPAAERARSFLDAHGAAFGLAGKESLGPALTSKLDEVGMEHVRFRQLHRGVPVTGGEIGVHLRGAAVVAVHAKTVAGLDHLATEPAIDAAAAREAALWLLDRKLAVTPERLSAPRLELFNRGLLEARRGFTRLAWFVEATSIDLRQYIWVDAESGAPLLHFSQLTDARDRDIHDADDPADGMYGVLPGVLVRGEGDAPTGDADADAAYDFSGDTYDYFFSEHGRDSYDDAGATLVSTVHYCPSIGSCPFANAFWNGTQMVYGDGYPLADDVDAHELTHAVTEHTANLYYYMQSGALNESFSDIFGEAVDLGNGAGDDSAGVRWLLGEDLPGGAIRDMADPTALGDPGKMSDAEFVCGDPGGDNGGVHSNSGVPNHAYVLMVDGGSYNGKTVTALGSTKADKIQYRALTHYLLSASDFLDAYNALNQSCLDLVGVAGISPADCGEVTDALDAVEISSAWPCAPAQAAVPAFCPAGQAPDLWFWDDVESSGLTACPTGTTPTSWCLNGPSSFLGPFATSGDKSYWAYDKPVTGSQKLTIIPPGTLPAGSTLLFFHSFGFENFAASFYYDGGVLEVSLDGGATWTDAGAWITAGQDYGAGTINTCCSNPLGGRGGFIGDSWGYTATQADLSTLGAGPFQFRFDLGTDFSVSDRGWFVDDIAIYTCASCIASRVLDATYNGLAAFYGASASLSAGTGFTVGPSESVTLESPLIELTDDFTAFGELELSNAGCP